jgi:parallel beta-helix repeat protein/putative cofactor-binding repeat protein
MSKLTLTPINSRYGSIDALNDNFASIEEAFENTVSRDGTGPNFLESDLDVNGNALLNVGAISLNGVPLEVSTELVPSTVSPLSFVATGGQTTFSVSPFIPSSTAALLVEVNGITYPPSSISLVGSSITIPACEAGDEVVIRIFTKEIGAATPTTGDNVSFIQAGVGAVQTNVQAKLRETVSVLDFGADPTGATDSTAAIQAACTASKRVDFGGAGNSFVLSGTVTLTSGAVMRGEGATITQTADQTPIFNAIGTDNVTITGLRMVGKSEATYTNTPSSQAIAIAGENATDLSVTNNRFENFYYSPLMVNSGGNRIEFSGNVVKGPGSSVLGVDVNYRNTTGATVIGTNVRIAGNEVYGVTSGFIIGQGSTDVVVSGNVIHDIINEHGIYADTGLRRLVIDGNVIRNTGVNGTGLKVQCYDSFGVQPENIVISNNAISATGGDGILIDNTTASPTIKTLGITIAGNTVESAGAYGIDIRDAQDCIVTNNTVIDPGQSGVAWGNCEGIVVADNYVKGSGTSGLRDLGGANSVVVRNNTLIDCAASNAGSDEYGILISSGGTDHVIEGNIISDSAAKMQYGIFIVPNINSTLSVVGNTVRDSTDAAIRFGSTAALREYRRNNWNGTLGLAYNDPVLPAVASASTITLPTAADVVSISGTTNITTINTSGHSGRRVTLFFQDALTVVRGSTIILNSSLGNFVTTANDTLTLVCDGAYWYEVARSGN